MAKRNGHNLYICCVYLKRSAAGDPESSWITKLTNIKREAWYCYSCFVKEELGDTEIFRNLTVAFSKSWHELECSICICVNTNRSITRIKSHDIQFKVFLSVSICAVKAHMWQVKEFK